MNNTETNNVHDFIHTEINKHYTSKILPAQLLKELNANNYQSPLLAKFSVSHKGVDFCAKPSLLQGILAFDTEFNFNGEFIKVTYKTKKFNATDRSKLIITDTSKNYQSIISLL